MVAFYNTEFSRNQQEISPYEILPGVHQKKVSIEIFKGTFYFTFTI